MPALSAIIITRNEAKNIAACLESVAFCDERIVVDAGSSDETVAIAESHGAAVTTHEWAGFGPQKNVALSLARGDWVLSIDADERVSPPLAAEIRAAIASPHADGYEMPRLSTFLGRAMRHSGWYPDYVLRLFRRENARFTDDLVHERVDCRGRIARLTPRCSAVVRLPQRRPFAAADRRNQCPRVGRVDRQRRHRASRFLRKCRRNLRVIVARAAAVHAARGRCQRG